jgi:hypothetical protein
MIAISKIFRPNRQDWENKNTSPLSVGLSKYVAKITTLFVLLLAKFVIVITVATSDHHVHIPKSLAK